MKNITLWLFSAALLVVFASGTASRLAQIDNGWNSYPEYYYANGDPVLSAPEAYKWINAAKELMLEDKKEVLNTPLLPALIKNLPVENIYKSAMLLIPFLSALFILPFAIFFYRIGLPLSGILGSVTGLFATTYYIRTSPGWTTPDALVLFFPCLTALLILFCIRSAKSRLFIFASLAGLSQLLFYWWSAHTAFMPLFLAALAVALILNGHTIKNTAIAVCLFIIFCDPVRFISSFADIAALIKTYTDPNGIYNVLGARLTFGEIMFTAFVHPVIVVMLLAASALLCVRKYKQIIPILPVFIAGLLAFAGFAYLIIFLAPLLGAAAGFLIEEAFRKKTFNKEWIKSAAGYAGTAVFILLLIIFPVKGLTFYKTSAAAYSPELVKAVDSLKESLPEKAGIYTWGESEYLIKDRAALEIVKDSTQRTAQAFTGTPEQLSDAADGNIILFTIDMISKFNSIERIASWNNVSSTPGNTGKSLAAFDCIPSTSSVLACGQNTINLQEGTLNGRIPIGHVSYVDLVNGKMFYEKDVQNSNIHIVVLQHTGVTHTALIMSKEAYNTAFTQLYILGNYAKYGFAELTHSYPLVRVLSK